VGGEMSLPHNMRLQRGYTTLTLCAKDGSTTSDLPMLAAESLAIAVPGVTGLQQSEWTVRTEIEQRTPGHDAWLGQLPLCERFDAAIVGRELCLRRWRAGDRMQPLGMIGERKVHDIMTDNRVPRALRRSIPLLTMPGRILWVPGSRRSEVGRVTDTTTEIIVVRFERGQAPG
jgi:tRNA(Ile)-lysidine synthase